MQVTEIRPHKGLIGIDWAELIQYRDLFTFLVWRDIAVRYKQTILGAGWAILQPLFTAAIFTVIFGKLAKLPSDGLPYAIFSYSGLVLWTYFSQATNFAAGSLLADERLVTKVYFPRLIIPMAPVIAGLVDLGISFVILMLILMPIFGVVPSHNAWMLPIPIALTALTAGSAGIWLSALNVKYRDFRYVIPFLIQVLMYGSPVVYPASLVPEHWRLLYAMNPLVGAIEAFRWSLLGSSSSPWGLIAVSAFSATVLFVFGAAYFKKAERFFADLI